MFSCPEKESFIIFQHCSLNSSCLNYFINLFSFPLPPQRTWSWRWHSWSCSSSTRCWPSSSPNPPCSLPDKKENQPWSIWQSFIYQADLLTHCPCSLEFFVIMITTTIIIRTMITNKQPSSPPCFCLSLHLPVGHLGLGDSLLRLLLLPLLQALKKVLS